MGQQDRERASDLMIRLNVSGHSRLLADNSPPQWLSLVVSQVLAITGESRIVTVGHTLTDYDFYEFVDGDSGNHVAEGKVQVLTEKLLVVSEFSAPNSATTYAYPLSGLTALSIKKVSNISATRGEEGWPGYVTFDVEIAGTTASFPPGPETNSYQDDELPAALEVVKAVLLTA